MHTLHFTISRGEQATSPIHAGRASLPITDASGIVSVRREDARGERGLGDRTAAQYGHRLTDAASGRRPRGGDRRGAPDRAYRGSWGGSGSGIQWLALAFSLAPLHAVSHRPPPHPVQWTAITSCRAAWPAWAGNRRARSARRGAPFRSFASPP